MIILRGKWEAAYMNCGFPIILLFVRQQNVLQNQNSCDLGKIEMNTFVPYTYVPTPPRGKHVPKKSNRGEELPRSTLSKTAFNVPPISAAATADSDIRSTTQVESYDDDDFPTVEQLLGTMIPKQAAAEESRLKKTGFKLGETAVGERSHYSSSASATSNGSSGSQSSPIVLADDDRTESEFESEVESDIATVDEGVPLNSNIDPTALNPHLIPDEWYDIDDLLDIAHNSERARTPNRVQPRTSSPHLPSDDHTTEAKQAEGQNLDDEDFPDDNDDDEHYRQGPQAEERGAEAAAAMLRTSEVIPPRSKASPAPANIHTYSEPNQDKLGNHNDDHSGVESGTPKSDHENGRLRKSAQPSPPDSPRSESNRRACSGLDKSVAVCMSQEQDFNIHCNVVEDPETAASASVLDLSQATVESRHDDGNICAETESGSERLNYSKYDSAEEIEARRPMKRKLHSRRDSLAKRQRTGPASLSSFRQRFSESDRLDDPGSEAARFNTAARVPRTTALPPATCEPQFEIDYHNINGRPKTEQPTLLEIKLRPDSLHRVSFSALIHEGCDGQGLSFSQAAQLIENMNIVGLIDDFTIKPLKQYLFLVSGFSCRTKSHPSHGRMPMKSIPNRSSSRTHGKDGSNQRWRGRRASVARKSPEFAESSNSDEDTSDIIDSAVNPSSDDEATSKHNRQGASRTINYKWSGLEVERLKAYKKEGKEWDWIFRKFPGRTGPAVRTRWSIIQRQEA